jgi:hypothetical protein
MDDPRRNTGRTTRMLEAAKALDVQGRAVYVVVAPQTMGLAREKLAGTQVKIETMTSFSRGFDLQTMTLHGAHPRCVVLVDHYVIESRYPKMVEEMHRYDEPASDAAVLHQALKTVAEWAEEVLEVGDPTSKHAKALRDIRDLLHGVLTLRR